MKVSRRMLRSKIHRATVTHTNVNYEGSITVPPELLAAADIAEYEAVHVWNVSTGGRFETYAIIGFHGSTDIAVNGAGAHLASPGDIIIIACFAYVTADVIQTHQPRLIFVDGSNRITESRREAPEPLSRIPSSS